MARPAWRATEKPKSSFAAPSNGMSLRVWRPVDAEKIYAAPVRVPMPVNAPGAPTMARFWAASRGWSPEGNETEAPNSARVGS